MSGGWTITLGVLVGIVFVAMIVQIALWLAIYGVARRVQARVQRSMRRVRRLQSLSREMMDENRDAVQGIAAHSTAIGKTLLHEGRVMGSFSKDVWQGVRTEKEHASVVVEDARQRANETVHLVSRGMMAPFRGVARGIHRAVHFFDRYAA